MITKVYLGLRSAFVFLHLDYILIAKKVLNQRKVFPDQKKKKAKKAG